METIYIKRFIKTLNDLPEEGKYWVHEKIYGDEHRDYISFFDVGTPHGSIWKNQIDWYLQPTTLAELIKEKLPSEDEIENESILQGTPSVIGCQIIGQVYWRKGAKYVINKLTE